MLCNNSASLPLKEKSLPNENVLDELDSAHSDSKRTGKWTKKEDEMLKEVVPLYGEKQWRKISMHMQGRTAIQCLHRWTKILKPGLVKGPWTREEDQKLVEWVKSEGPTKWAQASLVILGRSGKQCRERWFNNLSPQVKKGNWTVEEDDIIFKMYMQHGSSWSKIAKYIPGRTENSIKNRFYSTVRKIAADRKKGSDEAGGLCDENKKEQEESEIINEIKSEAPKSEKKDTSAGESQLLAGNTLYKLLQDKTESIALSSAVKPALAKNNSETTTTKKAKKYQKKVKKASEKAQAQYELSMNLKEKTMSLGGTSIYGDDEEETEENESEGQFENLLNSIEKTINKELETKNISNYKNMSLDELQTKVFEFCNNNVFELKADMAAVFSQPQLDIQSFLHTSEAQHPDHMDDEMLNLLTHRAEPPLKYTTPLLDSDLKGEMIKQEEEKDEKKMMFLLQQLHILEHMLSSTRTELLKLESSIQPEPNYILSPVYNVHEYNHHHVPPIKQDMFEPLGFENHGLFNENGINSKRKLSFEDFPGFDILKKSKIENFLD